MGLFDRLFGKKKDTKEQIEEQEIAQVLEETSADESKEVVETAAVEPQADEVVESGSNELTKMENTFRQLAVYLQLHGGSLSQGTAVFIQPFLEALADDLNTSNALAEVFKTLKEVNQYLRGREKDVAQGENYFKSLVDMFNILGLVFNYPTLDNEDRKLYEAYQEAKSQKNFALSDQLRLRLIEKNIL